MEIVGIAAASPSGQNVRPSMFFARSPIRVDIAARAAAVIEARQHLLQPGRAFAARNAPAAAFMRVELHDAQRGLHHVGVFVHDDHAARPEHRSPPSPASRNPSATSHSSAFSTGHDEPPGITAFNFLPPRIPPPTSSIICASGEAQRQLIDAGLVHMPGEAEQPRAAVLRRAERRERRAAIANDRRHRAERLDVVQHRGALERAGDRRKRRPDARDAALAFERFEQRRFLAALVRAGAGVRVADRNRNPCPECSCRDSRVRTPRRSRDP